MFTAMSCASFLDTINLELFIIFGGWNECNFIRLIMNILFKKHYLFCTNYNFIPFKSNVESPDVRTIASTLLVDYFGTQ